MLFPPAKALKTTKTRLECAGDLFVNCSQSKNRVIFFAEGKGGFVDFFEIAKNSTAVKPTSRRKIPCKAVVSCPQTVIEPQASQALAKRIVLGGLGTQGGKLHLH